MGTPDFAVPALTALSKADVRLSLVVTQPDRPKGRGRKLVAPPVKTAAMELGVPVEQPEEVRSDAFYQMMAGYRPDLLVVVAYGHILPKRILELPLYGAVNVHASLLPRYRGPAPIQWAIINGESETGVTTMLMDAGLDTGEILLTSKTAIDPADTAGSLHDRLAQMGGDLLRQTIEAIKGGTLRPIPQNHAEASHAPLLKKSDGRVDWSEPAAVIERKIRGLNPWPLAHTYYGDKRLNIFKAELRPADTDAAPGTVIPGFTGELRVAAGEGALSILEIQGASGKRLAIRDFLSGNPIPEYSCLK
mgnify:FL=1